MNKSAKIVIAIVILVPFIFIFSMFTYISFNSKGENKSQTYEVNGNNVNTEMQNIINEKPVAEDIDKAIEQTELDIYSNLNDKSINANTNIEVVSIDTKISVEIFTEINKAQLDAIRNSILDIVIDNGLSVDNVQGTKKAKYIKLIIKYNDEEFTYNYRVGQGFS